ncbi:thiamine phosphate synthase [Fulvivirga sp. M361]|uniref:thiamine phosphate synthase n=1 Tax=Fulvivirga sp. M361 TaxID=2594266 RepID=UPI001179B8C1|nr:thiamine phosphate synthase [Fulvivirga sp. M361]TRX56052.1 thiamine phosphate synthase [Fulvivirga sp. M361]
MISKLQYISQGKDIAHHLENIQKVCDWGCDWIQLRLKQVSDDEYFRAGIEAKRICQKYGARLIINDSVEVAHEINADGVHLGKKDAEPFQARTTLGKGKIIGGTANTHNDIISLVDQKVDYIGLGPYRFTQTKKDLSPVLGLEGYVRILNRLTREQCQIPVIAIGGIMEEDIKHIRKAGAYGVAVSGLLTAEGPLTMDNQKIYEQLQ